MGAWGDVGVEEGRFLPSVLGLVMLTDEGRALTCREILPWPPILTPNSTPACSVGLVGSRTQTVCTECPRSTRAMTILNE